MKVDSNIQSMQNIGLKQQVSANNLANVNSNGFKASTAVQQGDRISISTDARAAGQTPDGKTLSNTDVGREFANMSVNETGYSANVKAINTQSEMEKALFELKK